MSQPSVTVYFNTRKRRASEDQQGKTKILLLEREQSSDKTCDNIKDLRQNVPDEDSMVSPKAILKDAASTVKNSPCIKKAVRNINFDSPKANTEKIIKTPKARVLRSRRLFPADGHQLDIRESLQKMGPTDVKSKKTSIKKNENLSPKKPVAPKNDSSDDVSKHNTIKEEKERENEPSSDDLETPKISKMEKLATENLSLNDIKNRISKSSRLVELKASIARFKTCDQQLEKMQEQNDHNKFQMQKFKKIELEIPASLQKTARSPIKDKDTLKALSIQPRILLKSKDITTNTVKYSSIKRSAHQKHLTIAKSKILSLILPYNYRFLAEVFRCVETVSAMLFNRNELITFSKLKLAVQELLRRNFTQDHLAQIKTIYPDAYIYQQQKHHNFGSISKTEKYDLTLMPVVKKNNGRNTPDEDNILKSVSNYSMGPAVLLERRRKFYNTLLERVKDEHEKFLLTLETPIIIEKEKVVRWHPEFNVETCKEVEKAELPQPPQIEKPTAKNLLEKVKSLLTPGCYMEKALQKLAEANMTSKSTSSIQDSATQTMENDIPKVNTIIMNTPPPTPSIHQDTYLTKTFKGIPKSLLEKVRARQAAKALEEMTKTAILDKETMLYSKLPELAKILRNIYVAEKKGVLPMETVIQRLDNSFRMKLTPNEMDEHIRLLCKLLPTWISIHNVRKNDYLKLDRNADIAKVIKQLEISANNKVNK
ncbi:DNA replication factor Cdt1 [Harpegnathos saltator]|uniref:DNA replication factor Cdt1 n=1 Tax=Harpegnathos saltator TaxID=610380 RepID=E2BND6_HARSA|nr:DNA replication factor Cdt1 [Harpegnathos saltator]EFN82715.1 DNA replication factor Cdt1 [Harpegnathos saltator]